MSKMKHASGYTVRGDIAYGVYHAMLRLKPKTGEADKQALADFKAMLRSHTNLLTAAKAARKAMRGDPSFHEKCGEGLLYCPCPSGQAYRSLETAIAQAEGRGRI